MPSFRKLSPAEVAALDLRPASARAVIALAYDDYLAAFAVGDYGRAALLDGEHRAVVRRHLQAAARRRGLALRFRSGPGPLTFHVAALPAISATPSRGDCRNHPARRSHGRFTTAATTPATPSTPNRHRALS